MSFMEIEEEWAKEKAARQAVEQTHTPKPSRRWIWAVVAVVIVVGGLIAAGVFIQTHAKHPITKDEMPAGLIGIEVRTKVPALITVDGHKVGRAPVTIHVPRSTHPIGISDGKSTKAVIPDHDQTVDFVYP
jgi:hypothetical protein